MSEELSELETAAIQQAIMNRDSKKRYRPKPTVREKIVISKDEYQNRLIKEMRRDEEDARLLRESRLSQNIANWRNVVGERFRDAQTDNPFILKRIQRLESGNTHGASVVLSGDLGIGKTWLAYSYLNEMVKRGLYNHANIYASTETSSLATIAMSGFENSRLWEELKNPMHKVFFIDDVGQAHFTHETKRQEMWYSLIDHVYSHDLVLIMTTNKMFPVANGRISNGKQLEKWLGEAAYDRMKHIMGPEGLIVPSGPNKRPAVFRERENKKA